MFSRLKSFEFVLGRLSTPSQDEEQLRETESNQDHFWLQHPKPSEVKTPVGV